MNKLATDGWRKDRRKGEQAQAAISLVGDEVSKAAAGLWAA